MTSIEVIKKIDRLEMDFFSQNIHKPEILLLGREEYRLLIEHFSESSFQSRYIKSVVNYKQFDVYEVNVPSLIRLC